MELYPICTLGTPAGPMGAPAGEAALDPALHVISQRADLRRRDALGWQLVQRLLEVRHRQHATQEEHLPSTPGLSGASTPAGVVFENRVLASSACHQGDDSPVQSGRDS